MTREISINPDFSFEKFIVLNHHSTNMLNMIKIKLLTFNRAKTKVCSKEFKLQSRGTQKANWHQASHCHPIPPDAANSAKLEVAKSLNHLRGRHSLTQKIDKQA